MWGWKYWDVAIAIVGFLVQCGLAYLGLTMTHWKHKVQFVGLVLIGLAFTAIAVKRGADSAANMQSQLDVITRNTERPANITLTPPQVVVNSPASPKPTLQFSFWPEGPNERLIDTISRPIVNGVVTAAFTAKNTAAAQADNGQIWIQLCDGCKFAEEPEGATSPPDDPTVRRKHFDRLHAGAYFESTVLKIVPPVGTSSFTIAFKYACERCAPIDNEHPQKLRVNISTD